MKTHVSLAVRDIDASISFYTVLFNITPAQLRDDYALYVAHDPALELALYRDTDAETSAGTHFGIAVSSVAEVVQKMADLDAAGYATMMECETVCCYARQTKVWASDPNGHRWEIYVVHEELDDAGVDDVACCA